ncbi:hypothetical protein M3_0094 [Lysinibacillus phage vB_LfM_LysYB1]|nr:hypothetical protein M3_0094 [Lysinibacillus phage vB_LfM_LysYB1]WAB25397.1 hypothetical protein M5_0219 [Lysinibacillus phage vB_LfM_LysYB2]
MGEPISSLFKKLVNNTTFGEISIPMPSEALDRALHACRPKKTEHECGEARKALYEADHVITLTGEKADMKDCMMVIKRGKQIGWERFQ